MTGNNPNLDLVNINAYIKFGEILSICSKNIERKRNSHKSIAIALLQITKKKRIGKNPNLDIVNMNAYINMI